jgi:CRISPR-associated endoribonuclease Cas6
MLTSTTIHLRALKRGELPNTVGRFGHASFLALIESAAPELAQALHDADARKPFTVSPLRVADRACVNGHIRLREGDGCSMRFTILDSTLFQSFQSALIASSLAATIRLQNIPFAVEEAITTPRAEELTGYTTFAELRDAARDERAIALRFDSPTALSFNDETGKKFDLLPTPWRVFDSLCRKWNAFAETPIVDPKALRAWMETNMLVSGHNLRTEALQFDRFTQKGFVGSVVYETKSDDITMVRVVNALADFALYAGVGYKTTMGMGQCRRVTG